MERDQNKCVLCNLCVRVCDEEVGKSLIGLVG
ncbi:MAG: 4Fe-4S binding protein, partial [Lachnospiraceae bacterium]|nr:4Fe-4S binding protein [Lachnospiraceae bacterium]